MVFPVLKLGTLAVRTSSHPIVNHFKKQAARHPKFRQLIINIAQTNYRLTTTMQRFIYGPATDAQIPILNEQKAVQFAGDLIGELFVLLLAGGFIVREMQINSRAEAKREEEMKALKENEEERAREVLLLKTKLEVLETKLEVLEQPMWKWILLRFHFAPSSDRAQYTT